MKNSNATRGLVAALLVMNLAGGAVLTAAPDAIEYAKTTIGGILKLLGSKQGKAAKRKKLLKIYNESFDQEGFAKVTLKRQWKELTPQQRKIFVEKYGKFVFNFYFSKLQAYDNNEVMYDKADLKRGGKIAEVFTRVRYKKSWAKVNYMARLKNNKWYVYDAQIEGVKMSTTYRSQFLRVLKKSGFKGLTKEIDKLIRKYR